MTSSQLQLIITSGRLVLVEGQDEFNLFSAMLHEWDIVGLQIVPVGGKYGFVAGLEATLASARTQSVQLSAIGVVRDADADAVATMMSVISNLHAAGLQAPSGSGQFESGSPSVGVLILPDGHSPGAVEELCWESVKDTSIGRCVTDYLDCLASLSALLSTNTGKTLAHAYLAAQYEPSHTVGVGALKNYWPLTHPAFAGVKAFFETLADS